MTVVGGGTDADGVRPDKEDVVGFVGGLDGQLAPVWDNETSFACPMSADWTAGASPCCCEGAGRCDGG